MILEVEMGVQGGMSGRSVGVDHISDGGALVPFGTAASFLETNHPFICFMYI